ncbi:hypothetical protein B0H67DRAFT_303032 [Lasiosphaeris hirsuta]|uniref:Uncharacterized protein n=1 Tax=Lasiosphaeris hirsuta TaxID=260670 RepID=A0AA40DU45_9PEZI|nr:hypothetical protein B0H67DRAFT_303032 [Lasiosphaeris hirsuta]
MAQHLNPDVSLFAQSIRKQIATAAPLGFLLFLPADADQVITSIYSIHHRPTSSPRDAIGPSANTHCSVFGRGSTAHPTTGSSVPFLRSSRCETAPICQNWLSIHSCVRIWACSNDSCHARRRICHLPTADDLDQYHNLEHEAAKLANYLLLYFPSAALTQPLR